MSQNQENTLLDTLTWFRKAVPEPEAKNFTTQFGVHLEEVVESLQELTPLTPPTQSLLRNATELLHQLANELKMNGNVTVSNPTMFLDALCDQIVTATGTAHMLGYDIMGAMDEVNASNFSKFDEQGQPIFNENMKIMKGPKYFKPDLAKYIPS